MPTSILSYTIVDSCRFDHRCVWRVERPAGAGEGRHGVQMFHLRYRQGVLRQGAAWL